MLRADTLLLATPVRLGLPSSICRRVLELLDAELSETDEQGRLLTYGKVAVVAFVGHEDGLPGPRGGARRGGHDHGHLGAVPLKGSSR